MAFTYQLFGSSTSQDYDIIVLVDEIKSIQDNKKTCHFFEQQLQSTYHDKPLNINIAKVENSIITACFKGLPDELNNSLFLTYDYHEQVFSNHIQKLVQRNVEAKILRAIRVIVSHLSRTSYRLAIKHALKSDLKTQLDVLASIDFQKNITFKKGNPVDIYKSIAFQTGQTLALIHQVECFSKKEIIQFMKTQNLDFEPYLRRVSKPYFHDLQMGISNLIQLIIEQFAHLNLYNENTYHKAKSIK